MNLGRLGEEAGSGTPSGGARGGGAGAGAGAAAPSSPPHLSPAPGTLGARNLGAGARARRSRSVMQRARGLRAEADAPEEEAEEAAEEEEAMAAVAAAAGGAGAAVLQVAGLYRGLCAVRSRALGLGLVCPAQLRVFPVRRGSGGPAGGADGSRAGAELEANPFYDRYRDKIQQLRRCGPAGGGRERAARLLVSRALSVLPTVQRGGRRLCPRAAGDVCRPREAGPLAKITQLVSELRVSAELWRFPGCLSLCFSSPNAEVDPQDSPYEAGSSKRPGLVIQMGKWSLPEKGLHLLTVKY